MTTDVPVELQERVAKVLGQSCQYEPPLLPEVARAVLEATRTDDFEARAVADLLRRDAAMAAGVLRAANSPAYATKAPIVSLSHAISRLGFDAIRRIALLVACNEKVFCVKGRESITRELYFHSTVTAFVAQEIARHLKVGVEDAFIAGLLHDIGRAIALQAVGRLEKSGRRFADSEVDAIARLLHQPIGAHALGSWGLPSRTLAVVAHHHGPAEATEHQELVFLVSISDEIAHAMAESKPLDMVALAPKLAAVNLYAEDVDTILERKDQLMAFARGLT